MKTVSLELAQSLKEAGYPQSGYFVWLNTHEYENAKWQINHEEYSGHYEHIKNSQPAAKKMEWYFSPSADEILEQLPDTVNLSQYKEEGYKSYFCKLHAEGDWSKYIHLVEAESLADAAAKMWLYLKENNLLSLSES